MSTTDNSCMFDVLFIYNGTITFLFYVSLLTFCVHLRADIWAEEETMTGSWVQLLHTGSGAILFPGIPPRLLRPIFTYVRRCKRSRCCRAKSRAVTGPDIDRPTESWTRDGFGSSNWTIRPQKLSNDPHWAQFSFSNSYVVCSPSSTLIFIL